MSRQHGIYTRASGIEVTNKNFNKRVSEINSIYLWPSKT